MICGLLTRLLLTVCKLVCTILRGRQLYWWNYHIVHISGHFITISAFCVYIGKSLTVFKFNILTTSYNIFTRGYVTRENIASGVHSAKSLSILHWKKTTNMLNLYFDVGIYFNYHLDVDRKTRFVCIFLIQNLDIIQYS